MVFRPTETVLSGPAVSLGEGSLGFRMVTTNFGQ